MSLQEYSVEQVAASRWILADALSTIDTDAVLIVCDESTSATAECLRLCGKDQVGCRIDIRLVPRHEQQSTLYHKNPLLPVSLRKAIETVNRVIVLQGPEPDPARFRLRLLEYLRNLPAHRSASMPGVTLDTLELCKGNLEEIELRCALVADLLVRSRTAVVQTNDADDVYELTIPLGHYKPVNSTGRIDPHSWGNVPSGETFIVPNEGVAHGTVAIDGSVPSHVIGDEPLVLQFERGKATYVRQPSGALAKALEKILIGTDGRELYTRCSELAELGIGTNESISKFTGLPLFDEKVLGTIHLGLGSNTQFDGSIACQTHMDYVIATPTLLLDGIEVTRNGRFVLKRSDVYPALATIDASGLSPLTKVRFGPEPYEEIGGLAYLKWTATRALAPRTTRIGDVTAASYAAQVLHRIRELGGETDVASLGIGGYENVLSVIALLESFDVIEVVR